MDREAENSATKSGLILIFIFIVLLMWQIAMVWLFPHFVTQDGASHLYNASLIRSFHDPAWPRVTEFYRLNRRLVPNWSTYAALVGLYRVFSAPTAEKILVTAYFILFPLAFVYVLKTLTRKLWVFAIWGLIFANNLFIAMGFYNFCYSLIFFLLSFGYWMRWRDRFGPRQLLTLCALSSLLYFSHVVGFFMAAFFIGVVALCESRHSVSGILRRVLLPQIAFLPGLVIFLISSIGAQPAFDPGRQSFFNRLLLFRELHVLVDTRGTWGNLRMSGVGLFLVWGAYTVIAKSRAVAKVGENHDNPVSRGLGLLAAACLLLSVILPWSISGGGMIPERMAWFGLCATLLWLSSNSNFWTVKAQGATLCVAILVVTIGLIEQSRWRYQLSRVLVAYDRAGSLLVPQKTLLSLCYCNPADNSKQLFGNLRIRPLEHAGDIAALEGRALSLDNYEAMGSAFPVEYNSSVNPALNSTSISAASVSSKPQTADIADYQARTGKTVDYVLLWGGEIPESSEPASVLNHEIELNYELIYNSPPPAELRLFKRKPDASMPPETIPPRGR